ncbi:hypothetical protein BGX26_005022 [Mortierella sp. AD094]|nr:hypothetical protein BGX26_005022 [Mortierella sp. AD094]
MGQEVPSKKIDCDLDETKPFHICFTWNSIREILKVVTIQPPVFLNTMKYKERHDAMLHTCKVMDIADRLELKIAATRSKVSKLEEMIRIHDTDELVLLHQVSFDQDWKYFYIIQETILELPQQHWIIDSKLSTHSSINILEGKGGEGQRFWSVCFKRHAFEKGSYHVVLSIQKRNKFEEKIASWKIGVSNLEQLLVDQTTRHFNRLQHLRQTVDITLPTEIMKARHNDDLKRRTTYFGKFVKFATTKALDFSEFQILANAGIYRGKIDECASALGQFLIDRWKLIVHQ